MKEYIIHGTQNLESILQNKYIKIKVKKDQQLMLHHPTNQIFTQLLYRDLPNEIIQVPHFHKYCLILDKKLLKDYPFYATYIGGFYNNFNDAFMKDDKKTFIRSKGDLERVPNLKKLKNYIEDIMNNNIYGKISYIYSHEILFNRNISLKKYCKYIICKGDQIDENIINLAAKLKIPIKKYNDKDLLNNYGLNNFIDLIEK